MNELRSTESSVGLDFEWSQFKILIVDDVLSNILLLKAMLSLKKFQIVSANSGKSCLEQVKTENPDLILLDVMMPDMNGFDVATILKTSEEYAPYRDIPIIFLTALNSPNDIVKGFRSGANDFVQKPFNKDELMIRVQHQISLVAAKRIIAEKTLALEASIRNRDKMYSVIAHDLRAPIGTVKMMLEMMMSIMDPAVVGNEIIELINQTYEQTDETFSLLDNLLKWTKSQTGRLNVVYQQFKAEEILPALVDIYRHSAQVKGLKLTYIPTPTSQELIYADIEMLKTIVRNFISNALKFTPSGGEIKVYTTKDVNPDYIVFNVQDNGCGLSEEEKQKLFNTKTHFTKYGTNSEEGSGLGLLLCLDFARKNGGDLFLESKVDVGSTFSFTVPLWSEEREKIQQKIVKDDE
ncbi:MAG: hybrid sensor histidine kinase/response regulator [Bacteroidaceae bacterium]|nr:hybrid sensor histidine kinase/response regulator [Bacteroidaceae bacterium]